MLRRRSHSVEEKPMNTNPEMSFAPAASFAPASETPSADFIHAISEFLDTNPEDLLVELGYYSREDAADRSFTTPLAD